MEVSVSNQANYLHRAYDGMDNRVVHRRMASFARTLNRSDRQKRILRMGSSLHVEQRVTAQSWLVERASFVDANYLYETAYNLG